MNGGTNIALAVQKAGQLLKPLGPRTHRVLALLTDGRIDSHQVGGRWYRLCQGRLQLLAGLCRRPPCGMLRRP